MKLSRPSHALTALLAGVAVAASCGASALPSQARTSAASTNARAAASCGAVPNVKPDDPSGLLAKLKLPASQYASYNGWSFPILKSAWSNWKPRHKPPYKVAVITDITNSTNAAISSGILNDLKHSSIVGKVLSYTLPSATDVTGQLQQYQAAVQQKPDLIIFEPLSPTAAQADIVAAGKRGIPTVSVFNNIDSAYAVSIASNPYVGAAYTASALASTLGGKGNILQVLGAPTAETTVAEQQAWTKVFSTCPGIKLVGQTYGFFSTALAKTQTLQWLTTNSGSVDGAIESGAMALGVLQAFQQSGRPVPVIGQIGGLQGVAQYWKAHRASGYKWAATIGGAGQLASETATVATRILAGQGPKINFFPWNFVPFSSSEILPLISSSWSVGSDRAINLPAADAWGTADYDRMFNEPTLTHGTRF